MKGRTLLARRCRLEVLEDRRLMAGDVSARIDHGNLIVRGDNADNGIQILGGLAPGEVRVLGTQVFGIDTRVNGVVGAAVTLTGFNGRIDIALDGGSDNVRIESFTSRGITADLGRGTSNRFELYNHTVTGDLSVKSLEGNDQVIMNGDVVNGSLSFDLGDGSNNVNSTGGSVGRDAKYRAGRGADSFTIASMFVGGAITANLGDGQNNFFCINLQSDRVDYRGGKNADSVYFEVGDFNWVTVDVGQGDNKVDLHGPRLSRDLYVKCGSGNDTVLGDENTIGGNAKIELGDGNNSLRFLMDVKGDFAIRGGRNSDDLELDGQFNSTPVVYRSLEVALGDGANTLHVSNIAVACEAEFEGGKDGDLFNWSSASFDSFFADLGDGANSFHFASSTVQRDAEFEAGCGSDSGEIAGSKIFGNMKVNLGNGNNGALSLNTSDFHGDVVIRDGNGSDSTTLYLVHFFKSLKADFGGGGNNLFIQAIVVDGRAEFLGGNDSDNYEINFLSSASLNVAVGKGNDELRISSTSTTGLARFDGGDGQDSFLVSNNFPNSFASVERKNFETFGTYNPT
jgi:hypothetical protein